MQKRKMTNQSQMTAARSRQADIVAVIGASGSGKTHYVMSELKRIKARRVLVWDAKGEFIKEGYTKNAVSSIHALVDAVRGKAAFSVSFVPFGDNKQRVADFSKFCEVAFHVKNCVLIAEELGGVTSPTSSPAGWFMACTQGRTEGLTIYGLSQTPAMIDKDFFGNCSRIRVGRLVFAAHIKSMCDILGVSKDDILGLGVGQYIQRDMLSGAITRG